MKKVTLAIILIAAISFASCGDKKAKDVEKDVKTEVKKVEKKVEEKKTEIKEVATKELSEVAQKGFNLMESFTAANKCSGCHKTDAKSVGPSFTEIAKTYKEKKGSFVKFLKEQADPIVDPAMFPTMKANLQVTKKLSGDELNSIITYIRSFE